MTDAELIEAQHRVLLNMPCWCAMRWIKDGAEREVVKECSRCAVLREYQEHHGL